MRTFAVVLATTVASLSLGACGSSESDAEVGGTTEIPSIGSPSSGAPAPTVAPSDSAAVGSTLRDADAYAVQLEQVFFNHGYPDALAEVLPIAAKLDLRLAPGNRIAGYVYDADAEEFRLCVENTSGAFAVYDTQPMSTLESGPAGGCPF